MDEANHHPAGDEFALPLGDALQQGEIGIVRVFHFGIVAVNHMIRKISDPLIILARGEELEGADPDMACRNTGENPARQTHLALHPVTGQDGGERPCRGNAEREHCLGDDIFA
ncbi:hypothetical protein D3C77_620800 [compost metagenome]